MFAALWKAGRMDDATLILNRFDKKLAESGRSLQRKGMAERYAPPSGGQRANRR